jgi:Flp pilus assembly protein TadB
MEAFHSPFIIPLGAFAVAIVAIVAGIWADINNKRIRADQRMAMIARGVSIEEIEKLLGKSTDPDRPPKDPLRSLSNARRAGIVLVSSGIGIVLFFLALTAILQVHEVLSGAAVGLIPLAIGIGFFVDYNLQKRELSRFGMEIEPDHSRS